MKTKITIKSLLAFVVAAILGLSVATAKDTEKTQAELQARAKITKEVAQKTALAKVPDGTVKEGELEEENGKLIWSFDITRPGTRDITEVNVDAITGEGVDVAVETAKDKAKEDAEDAAKTK